MSRGPGRVQRHVLERARGLGPLEWLTASELAAEVYDDPPLPTQVQAVRRAIRSLADDGLVVMEYVERGGAVVLAVRGSTI